MALKLLAQHTCRSCFQPRVASGLRRFSRATSAFTGCKTSHRRIHLPLWTTSKGSTRLHTQLRRFASMSTTDVAPVAFFPERYPEVQVTDSDAFSSGADLLAILVPEEAFKTDKGNEDVPAKLGNWLSELDSTVFSGLLEALSHANGFQGKEGSSAVGPWLGGSSKLVALIGLGNEGKTKTPDKQAKAFRDAGKQIAVHAKSSKSKIVRVKLWDDKSAVLGSLSNGILLGGYEATRFKAKAKISPLENVFVHTSDKSAAERLDQGSTFAKGTLLSRYLVEAPPNVCTPSHLAEAAKKIQEAAPDVFSLEVLEREQCAELKMGLYLGVAECSELPPKFIHLTYKSPGDGEKKVLAIIGKGLTFDSGGYNIKAAAGSLIEMMKFDMGGAGAILGAAHILGQLKPANLEIHFITASCENMIDGKGMRPGDILTSASGKTVEITNTDAEGRLTLADALWFAQEKCNATKVVDIATLTGAQMVALGTEIGAIMSPSDQLSENLIKASNNTGDLLWRLPLQDSYWVQMKSNIADMKNSGIRFAGTITAGLFLKQYVNTDKVEWAHIDIAGPAWAWNESPQNATGFGSAVLAKWALEEASS